LKKIHHKEKKKRADGVAQVVDHLPSKHEAPNSKPSTAKKNKRKEKSI
jgi:hypothetical protein